MTTSTPDRTATIAVDLLVSAARFTRLATRESSSTIPHALWRALSQIEDLGPLRISELARADRCSQPTATTMVQRLEERGWVLRSADPDDSRAVLIAITDEGRAELTANREIAASHLEPRIARLSARDQAVLTDAVRVLHDMMRDEESV